MTGKTVKDARVHDVIVVGSGAGGSAATSRLAAAGLDVLLVEKGVPLPRDRSTLNVDQVVRLGVFKSKEPWRDGRGKELVPEEYFNLGGKTKWYGAALARFSPEEFAADETHQCIGWPFTYEALAPYYEEAERVLAVRQFACEPDLGRIVARLTGNGSGWRAVPLPMGLADGILADREEASHFDGFASVRALKSDGESTFLRRVAGARNLAVVTGIAVESLIGDPRRPERVTGVRLANGEVHYARETLLAAGAMHSPRLLQRYVVGRELDTLRVAPQIGRNFKLHLLTALLAVSPTPKTDLLRKTTLLLNDAVPHSSVQPLGFDSELIATLVPHAVPRGLARRIGSRAYGFFLQTEDGSHRDNRIMDANGSAPVMDYEAGRLRPAQTEHRRLLRLFRRALNRAGFVALSKRIGLAGTAHACGTLVTGSDPGNSVVDPDGRVHGMEGLRVVDGSILPRSSRVNPALTIYAFSLKAADRLIADLKLRQAS